MQFVGATLGGPPQDGFARYALDAYGLVTAELVLKPATAPGGAVRLTQARVGSLTDSEILRDA